MWSAPPYVFQGLTPPQVPDDINSSSLLALNFVRSAPPLDFQELTPLYTFLLPLQVPDMLLFHTIVGFKL